MSHKQKHVGPTSSRVSPPLGALPSQPDSPEVQLPPPEPERLQIPSQAVAVVGHGDAVQQAPGNPVLKESGFLTQPGGHGQTADKKQKVLMLHLRSLLVRCFPVLFSGGQI